MNCKLRIHRVFLLLEVYGNEVQGVKKTHGSPDIYATFHSTVVTNEPGELGAWNCLQKYTINIPIN
jgi:hypothetical protein